jgi:uncharacterized RDD family membrane protein YckC
MSNPYETPESDVYTPDAAKPYVYAGFWIRAAATLIDTLLMMLCLFPIVYILMTMGLMDTDTTDRGLTENLLSFVFIPIVVMIFWRYRSATPGKMLFKLAVIDANSGGRLAVGQMLLRYLGYYIGLIPLGLGFLWVGWDKKKQGFHDKIASTMVVRYTDEPGAVERKEPPDEI